MNKKKSVIALFLCLTVISIPVAIASQQNLVYDANGNLITGDGKYREYNAFNQLVKVRQGNSTAGTLLEDYIYHPTEERVLVKRIYDGTNEPRKIILYVNENFVREYGALNSGYLKINDTYYTKDDAGTIGEIKYNGTRLAKDKNFTKGKTLFYHNDQKSSVAVVTNGTGSIIEQTFYEPFGKILAGGTKTRYTYEGKELDSLSSNFDFHFRQYNPEWAKFTQPDTVIQNVYDPQSLNRYSFERNNPYKNIDKTGHQIPPAWPLFMGQFGAIVTIGLIIVTFVFYVYATARTPDEANTNNNEAFKPKEKPIMHDAKPIYDLRNGPLDNQVCESQVYVTCSSKTISKSLDESNKMVGTSTVNTQPSSYGLASGRTQMVQSSEYRYSVSNPNRAKNIREDISHSSTGTVEQNDIIWFINPDTGNIKWKTKA
ncbi:MAG: RHS repeat-associated core domain-containing protein [Candidatus Woesearchaeota archaeon]